MTDQDDVSRIMPLGPDANGRTRLLWSVGRSDHEVAFDARASWPDLVSVVDRGPAPIVLLTSGRQAGPGRGDPARLRTALAGRGAEVRYGDDADEADIAAMLARPQVGRLLDALRGHVVVSVVPASRLPAEPGWTASPNAALADGTARVGLTKDPAPEALGHPLVRLLMDLEGYPGPHGTITASAGPSGSRGGRDAPHRPDTDPADDPTIQANLDAVLDVEAAARLAEAGFDPAAWWDARARDEMARARLPAPMVRCARILFRLRTLGDPDLRERWIAWARGQDDAAVEVAEAIADAFPERLDPLDAAAATMLLLAASDGPAARFLPRRPSLGLPTPEAFDTAVRDRVRLRLAPDEVV